MPFILKRNKSIKDYYAIWIKIQLVTSKNNNNVKINNAITLSSKRKR